MAGLAEGESRDLSPPYSWKGVPIESSPGILERAGQQNSGV